jgi:uncharacterized protein (TIGR03435 family)
LLLLCTTTALPAQTPEKRTLEVASIKPVPDPTPFSGVTLSPGGRLVGENVTVQMLVAMTFGGGRPLASRRILGGPAWILSEHFNIVAKAGNDVPDDELALSRQRPSYLRGLLEDRFKLKHHWEKRRLPIYTLTLARKDGELGPTLRRRAAACDQPPACDMKFGPGPGALTITGASMAFLAETLATSLSSAVVVNQTNLDGLFDLELHWLPEGFRLNGFNREQFPDIDPNGPSIVDAVQDQLGLKLESSTGNVDVLVIDHVERPGAN